MESVESQKYKLNVKPPRVISLILLCAFAAMGAALITPALPSISNYFHISNGVAQLTVTSFLLGYALGQLLYGPLANRFGRKPAFFIGITIATIGTIFSIMSSSLDSFSLMVLGRFLEALGASVGLVVCFTIINDFYFPQQARPMLGFMALAFALVPGIAVATGGLITEYAHWQLCFYVLLAYGLLLIIPSATLPETLVTYDPKALHGRYLLKNYLKMFKNRKLMAYAIIYGLTAACSYVFSAEGPIIGISTLGYNAGTYGLLGLIPYIGAVLGAFIMIKYSAKISAHTIIVLGISCECLATAIMLISFLFHFLNIFTLLIPMAIFMIGHAILSSASPGMAIGQSDDKANASAVVSFVGIGTAVIGTFLLSMIHSQNVLVLPNIFLVAMLAMWLVYYFFLSYSFV